MPIPINPQFDPSDFEHNRDVPGLDPAGVDFNGPGSFPLISPSEATEKASAHLGRILSSQTLLKEILDGHKPTIHRRWVKKTRNQRQEILLRAWPNMSTAHRPDFLAFRKETERERKAGTQFRNAYIYPHINLEDLSKPKSLLLMLQSRSRNSPGTFAFADLNAVHLGYMSEVLVHACLDEHIMMLAGRTTPDRYGEIVSQDDNSANSAILSGNNLYPGEELLVLEIQETIMRFLVDICKLTLHDIPASNLISDKWPRELQLALPRVAIDGLACHAVMVAEAPYRLPAEMDLLRLESLLEAKTFATEDHVWALREDPGYFASVMMDLREHRHENLKDTDGWDHPLIGTEYEDILWQRVINSCLDSAHYDFEVWYELLAQVKELRRLQSFYGNKISPEAALPERYLDALLRFQHYLIKALMCGPVNQLKHNAFSSPPLRHMFVRLPSRDQSSSAPTIVKKPSIKLGRVESELFWLLQALHDTGDALLIISPISVVDELERLVQGDAKAKALISAHVANIFADMFILNEALRELQSYQPWSKNFAIELVDKGVWHFERVRRAYPSMGFNHEHH